MATHSSVLAWRLPGMGEPGGLPSVGSHRVGHDWSDLAAAAAVISGSDVELLFLCFFLKKSTHKKIRVFNSPREIGFLNISLVWILFQLPTPGYFLRADVPIAPQALWMNAAAAAKSLQSSPTLCDPTDGSPPGSPIPGSLQARTLEWVAIAFSNVWKWKVKVKSLSRIRLLATPWTAAHLAPPSLGFSRQEHWSGVPLPFPKWMLNSPKLQTLKVLLHKMSTRRQHLFMPHLSSRRQQSPRGVQSSWVVD